MAGIVSLALRLGFVGLLIYSVLDMVASGSARGALGVALGLAGVLTPGKALFVAIPFFLSPLAFLLPFLLLGNTLNQWLSGIIGLFLAVKVWNLTWRLADSKNSEEFTKKIDDL